MESEYVRIDGKKCGRDGVSTNTIQLLLTPGQTADFPRNDKRVALIVTNIGDTAGNSSGVISVRCYPDDDNNQGYTSGNGAMLTFGGAMQFDRNFPWIGIIRIVGLLANTYVQILELYDAG